MRELNDISSFKKKIPNNITNEDWQIYFSELRNKVKPSQEHRMKLSHSILVNDYNNISHSTYCENTEWQYYCKFINSILNTIRSGECDYCFHIYQILDLLRFEYDRLKVIWLPKDECFEVSLELNQKNN